MQPLGYGIRYLYTLPSTRPLFVLNSNAEVECYFICVFEFCLNFVLKRCECRDYGARELAIR